MSSKSAVGHVISQKFLLQFQEWQRNFSEIFLKEMTKAVRENIGLFRFFPNCLLAKIGRSISGQNFFFAQFCTQNTERFKEQIKILLANDILK